METQHQSRTVWTVGHSTRTIDEFFDLLRAHEINGIVDVRRYPGSRRYPHFGGEALRRSLEAAGIGYRHAPELGGRREPRKDSRHTAWRSPSFRAYADHMESAVFQGELARLIAEAESQRNAIMCAEAVPWRCHRQLISDALTARDVTVLHILTPARGDRHELSEHARVTADGGVLYDGGDKPADAQTELGLDG